MVNDLFQLAEQVAGNQHRGTALPGHPRNQRPHFLNPCRVQPVGGFVQNQKPGTAQQRHGNAQTLAHSQRILSHLAAAVLLQMHDVQHTIDVLFVHAFQVRHNLQIFLGGQVAVTAGIFNQTAGLAQQRQTVLVVHGLAQQLHMARGGMAQPQQHFHGGGFARAVGADKAVHTALGHRQRHMVHRKMAAELLAQPGCFNYIHTDTLLSCACMLP